MRKNHRISTIGSITSTQGSGNKIVTHDDKTHIVWQDQPDEDYFNRIRTYDHATETLSEAFTLNQGRDGKNYEMAMANPESEVGLYRGGTRVLPRITELDSFQSEPWTSGLLQGIVDALMLNLTPGTRTGIVRDAVYEEFWESLRSSAGQKRSGPAARY